jgi:hypothetical protein
MAEAVEQVHLVVDNQEGVAVTHHRKHSAHSVLVSPRRL